MVVRRWPWAQAPTTATALRVWRACGYFNDSFLHLAIGLVEAGYPLPSYEFSLKEEVARLRPGSRIRVHWSLEDTAFSATVVQVFPDGTAALLYDDGCRLTHQLYKMGETWEPEVQRLTFGSGDGPETLVGTRIETWRVTNEAWFAGKFVAFNAETGKHSIKYDDGETEKVQLQFVDEPNGDGDVVFRLLDCTVAVDDDAEAEHVEADKGCGGVRKQKRCGKQLRGSGDKSTGVRLRTWKSSKTWRADIVVDGKTIHLGSFKIKKAAIKVRKQAANVRDKGMSAVLAVRKLRTGTSVHTGVCKHKQGGGEKTWKAAIAIQVGTRGDRESIHLGYFKSEKAAAAAYKKAAKERHLGAAAVRRTITQVRKPRSNHKGVSFDKSNKSWMASITIYYEQIHLGYFKSEKAAAAAYKKAAKKRHLGAAAVRRSIKRKRNGQNDKAKKRICLSKRCRPFTTQQVKCYDLESAQDAMRRAGMLKVRDDKGRKTDGSCWQVYKDATDGTLVRLYRQGNARSRHIDFDTQSNKALPKNLVKALSDVNWQVARATQVAETAARKPKVKGKRQHRQSKF